MALRPHNKILAGLIPIDKFCESNISYSFDKSLAVKDVEIMNYCIWIIVNHAIQNPYLETYMKINLNLDGG